MFIRDKPSNPWLKRFGLFALLRFFVVIVSSVTDIATHFNRPLLALSTSWCSARHSDGYDMLREIAGLGFSHVELSHGIRITLVPGILRALEEGVIKVCSTHNFCPLPMGFAKAAPNAFEPSLSEATHHDQWVRQTRRSLDFAAQVGARALVTHLGSVRFWWRNPVEKLLARADELRCAAKVTDAFAAQGGVTSPAVKSGDKSPHSINEPVAGFAGEAGFAKLRERTMGKIRARMGTYWGQVKASVEEVRAHAVERGVALGFENRERPDELPLDEQFEELFAGIAQPNNAGYWHDTGHAHLKEQLGLIDHRAHLEKNAARLIGFHLHDTTADGRDHQAVGEGGVDFEMVSRFWKPHHLLVLELGPRVPVEGVKNSKNRIEALLSG